MRNESQQGAKGRLAGGGRCSETQYATPEQPPTSPPVSVGVGLIWWCRHNDSSCSCSSSSASQWFRTICVSRHVGGHDAEGDLH